MSVTVLPSLSDPPNNARGRSLRAGDTLGRFQLLVPIGEGGMGRVWVAREQGSAHRPRLVAIKTALAEGAAAEEYWNVLLDEARIASMIHHPNVCAIHALNREGAVVYLVMDWSDGGTLRELLDAMPENRLEPTLAARIVGHVCAGLQAAHELLGKDGSPLGVVHRDVSPQNVLLSSGGRVQITDFGVAKARGQLHAPTQTGEVKGKLSYMAPEQVTTKDVDRRADIFALGCVLYEASCGVRPFHGGDALATLYQLLEQEVVPPSQRLPDYPAALERIVLKALERNPEARFQTIEEMGRALESWLASERAMIGDRQVAQVVTTALGERIARRARAVESALTSIEGLDSSVGAAGPTPPHAETLSGSAANAPPKAEPRKPSRRLVWTGILASVPLVGAVFVVARPSPPASEPAPSTVTRPAPAVPTRTPVVAESIPASPVVITLRAEPSHATLQLDDGPPLTNPARVSVVPDGRLHRIRASAPHHTDQVQEVRFEQSQEIALVLTKKKPSQEKNAPPPLRPQVPPKTAPAPAEPPPQTKPGIGELPEVTKRPPRTLDADNPFSKP